jgi:hypothetical protein
VGGRGGCLPRRLSACPHHAQLPQGRVTATERFGFPQCCAVLSRSLDAAEGRGYYVIGQRARACVLNVCAFTRHVCSARQTARDWCGPFPSQRWWTRDLTGAARRGGLSLLSNVWTAGLRGSVEPALWACPGLNNAGSPQDDSHSGQTRRAPARLAVLPSARAGRPRILWDRSSSPSSFRDAQDAVQRL